jgi:hypothetical protein
MATIVLQVAAVAIGKAVGASALGAAIGTAAASIGGYLIDQALFGQRIESGRMSSMRPTVAEEGAPLPRIYGAARLGGTLIWATRFEETKTKRRGSKGGQKSTEYTYFANFAIAVAEGEINHIRRIWADGKEFDQTHATIRVHMGKEDQLPDPLIEAKQGPGNAPGYRGTAYVVFERLPLDDYGNRLPQFQFEVVRAIRDAKARNLSVTLYPFVMLDVPANNELPDPYGASRQAAFPWRGRITCHPAPYHSGSVNGTAAAAGQIEAFLGNATNSSFRVVKGEVAFRGAKSDWGYRRMVLHMAQLAIQGGGVDTLLLGSELCGLTVVREQNGGFPFVNALCTLASDLRDVLGAVCKLTYGADWTEYFGHHPQDGSGDVYFHLDPLWAHPAITAVGIDNYMPLSDWRDEDYGVPNPDGFAAPYDLPALQGQIASGEGFDWYYASSRDRLARVRTPIGDGNGKPWVYRYKDITGWWQNWHYNRKDGVESTVPTAWQPRMKPFWLTEVGCPAADKGPNQPNVFPDMKSSEGAFPYFSDQGRCDLAQNRFLRAHFGYWTAGHAGSMLDTDRLYVWAWDTRPFPEFPLNRTLWADGRN